MFQDTLFPICFILLIGAILRKIGLINGDFIKFAAQLMHRMLLPVFFFWIISNGNSSEYFDWRVYLAAIFSILVIYLIAHIFIRIFKTSNELSFIFATSAYRINLFLGLSLIFYLSEKDVMREFCIFLLFLVPFVDLLTWIGSLLILNKLGKNDSFMRNPFKRIFLNSTLIAGILGLLSSNFDISIPVFLNKTFEMISSIIFPLALILTGGALIQPRIKSLSKFSLVGSGLKTILMPLLVYLFLQLFTTNIEVLYIIVPFFALPFILDRKIVITERNIQQDYTSQFTTVSAFVSFLAISFWFYLKDTNVY